jgi:hypothetical protein
VGLATLAASGAILYSLEAQRKDKQVMRAGVERDKERLRALLHNKSSSSSCGDDSAEADEETPSR